MPRKLSREEANKLGLVPMGKKHPVRALIEKMEADDEVIHVTRDDFKWKGHTPKRLINEIERKTGKKFLTEKLINGKGWVVQRLK